MKKAGRAKSSPPPAAPGAPAAPSPVARVRALVSRYSVEVFYVLALAACMYAYHEIGDNYLYNDDFRWMRQARNDMRPENLLTFQVTGFFRPLMNLLFYVTERLMPGNIGAYYATNILLHFCNGVLVFHFIGRVFANRMLAAGTALFFLITCTHWAAVGWISARTALVSTALLLASLMVVTDQPRARWRRGCALGLYTLSLLAKEDAVIGVALLALVWWFRDRRRDRLPDIGTLAGFGAVTVAYLVMRTFVIGHVAQDNWGPGLHALRNLAGGFLYEIYPWAVTSLFHVFDTIEVQTHPVWPEILALPVLVVLLVAGRLLGRSREMRFALAWLFVALLPMALFRFRFLTTDWLTHDRYYYLSSIGAALCVAVLLGGLWNLARWQTAARSVVIVCIALIIVGERVAIRNRAGRFHRMTKAYSTVLTLVSRRMSQHPGVTTCAIQNWPLQRPFLQDIFLLERPGWRVVSVESRDDAAEFRPCVYIQIHVEKNRVGTEAALIP
jgi:hypothetical protein